MKTYLFLLYAYSNWLPAVLLPWSLVLTRSHLESCLGRRTCPQSMSGIYWGVTLPELLEFVNFTHKLLRHLLLITDLQRQRDLSPRGPPCPKYSNHWHMMKWSPLWSWVSEGKQSMHELPETWSLCQAVQNLSTAAGSARNLIIHYCTLKPRRTLKHSHTTLQRNPSHLMQQQDWTPTPCSWCVVCWWMLQMVPLWKCESLSIVPLQPQLSQNIWHKASAWLARIKVQSFQVLLACHRDLPFSQSLTSLSLVYVRLPSKKFAVAAIIVPRVTCDLQLQPIPFDLKWNHLLDIQLADLVSCNQAELTSTWCGCVYWSLVAWPAGWTTWLSHHIWNWILLVHAGKTDVNSPANLITTHLFFHLWRWHPAQILGDRGKPCKRLGPIPRGAIHCVPLQGQSLLHRMWEVSSPPAEEVWRKGIGWVETSSCAEISLPWTNPALQGSVWWVWSCYGGIFLWWDMQSWFPLLICRSHIRWFSTFPCMSSRRNPKSGPCLTLLRHRPMVCHWMLATCRPNCSSTIDWCVISISTSPCGSYDWC